MKKKFIYIFVAIIILLFSNFVYAGSNFTNLAENTSYYKGINALSLFNKDDLFLPKNNMQFVEDEKNFSLKGQEKLFNIASQFDRNENNTFNNFINELDNRELTLNRVISYNGEELESISFDSNSNFYINADYNDELSDLASFTQTSLNFNYQLNNKTMLRASYGLLGKKWEKSSEVAENNNELDGSTETEYSDNLKNSDKENDYIYNSMIDQQGRFGVSFQSSDNFAVSADYIKENIFHDSNSDSTIFGFEYEEDEGKISGKYEIVNGEEKKEMITGLELDITDLASFSASYKLLDPQFIQNKLDKESIWDFGVDINISQATIFSVDYQLIDNVKNSDDSNEFFTEKQSNLNASFKINF